MKTLIKASLIILILAMLILAAQASSQDALAQSGQNCQCVVYVVHRLFGKPLANPWNNLSFDGAYQLANEGYWSASHLQDSGIKDTKGLVRYRVNNPTPQFGDVIIFQPNATFWVYDANVKDFVKQTRIGWDDARKDYVGHIGFVRRAVQGTRKDGSTTIKGWYVNIESTNWPANWSITSLGTVTVGSVTCNNLTRSDIFVPYGASVSFWRVK